MGLQGMKREAAERRERDERFIEELKHIRMLYEDQQRILHTFMALLHGQALAFLLDRHTQSGGKC